VAVVEKTPLRCVVRRAEDDHIVSANHFLTPELAADPANVRYLREGTSLARYEQMEALVTSRKGSLTPQVAVDILRTTSVPNINAGLGNPAAINAIVATHSVVIDVTDGVLWVSVGPHQLGPFIPFTVDSFESGPARETILADPMLTDGSYDRYLKSADTLAQAEALLKKGKTQEAAQAADEAARLNPGSYKPLLMRGRIGVAGKDWSGAKDALHAALARGPAYASERAQIEGLLSEIAKSEAAVNQ
jgi:hypothetical protein